MITDPDAGGVLPSPARKRTIILGAAGRDLHNFNVLYRADRTTGAMAITARQIPHIGGRRYAVELAARSRMVRP